jgi:hypothetical protein
MEAVLGILAGLIGSADAIRMCATCSLYPVYYCLGNAAIALLIVSRAGTVRPQIP